MRDAIIRPAAAGCGFCFMMMVAVSWAQQSLEQKSSAANSDTKTAPATQGTRIAQPDVNAKDNRPSDAKQPSAPADPTGSWKWDFDAPDGNKLQFTLKLKWDGKKLEGSYSNSAFENTAKVEDGKIDKDAVSFVVRQEFFGNSFVSKFNGKVAKDEIKGTIGLNFGDQPQEFPWTAKRFIDSDDVIGLWDLTIQAPNFGEIQSKLTITKDAKGLKAKYANDFFDVEAKSVQIKENELLFEIASDTEQLSFKSNYRGTPRGNAMEGKSTFDIGGNAGEMTFTGKRQPPKDEKQAERPASAETRPAAGKQEAKEPAAAAKSDGK